MGKGPTPAVAIFSVFSRYKREASRASVFAAKVLNEAGIRVTMKVAFLNTSHGWTCIDVVSLFCDVERPPSNSVALPLT